MFIYKVQSAQGFKEGFTDIINVSMFSEKYFNSHAKCQTETYPLSQNKNLEFCVVK